MLAEGDAAAAAQIYAEVLAIDSTNIAALAGLAKCYVTTGAIEQARQTHCDGAGIQAQRSGGQGRAGRNRSRRTGASRRPGDRAGTESRRKPARSSGAIRSGDRAQRAGQASPRRPTSCWRSSSATAKWNDDGARKQLVQFFEAWGGADEATVDGRKRLSTILFS